MDADSISTGDIERNDRLKSIDFFNTKSHKQITFISSIIRKLESNDDYELSGELPIKGISKK
jgi:polyisoprenoid-binding protein YceI